MISTRVLRLAECYLRHFHFKMAVDHSLRYSWNVFFIFSPNNIAIWRRSFVPQSRDRCVVLASAFYIILCIRVACTKSTLSRAGTWLKLKFQVLTATSVKMAVFSFVSPCSLVANGWRSTGASIIGAVKHREGINLIWTLASFYQITRRNMSEDSSHLF